MSLPVAVNCHARCVSRDAVDRYVKPATQITRQHTPPSCQVIDEYSTIAIIREVMRKPVLACGRACPTLLAAASDISLLAMQREPGNATLPIICAQRVLLGVALSRRRSPRCFVRPRCCLGPTPFSSSLSEASSLRDSQ